MERPIIFSGPMVRAILEGKKTMTRRVVRPQPAEHHWSILPGYKRSVKLLACNDGHFHARFQDSIPQNIDEPVWVKCPHGKPGDVLWVRETWQYYDWTEEGEPWIKYGADEGISLTKDIPEEWWDKVWDTWADLSAPDNFKINGRAADRKWRPSIFMPRWASRITLEIVDVRVERLQEISRADAKAEGFFPGMNGLEKWAGRPYGNAQLAFKACWEDINGKKPGCSWADNPWVWVISFRKI